MIGGNTYLALQVKTTSHNAIGEAVEVWANVRKIKGWLDYQSGDSPRTNYNKKTQESTHVFISDYINLNKDEKNPEKTRAIIDGEVYEILIIDNPMGKNRQLEFSLKKTGAQNEQNQI